MSSPEAQPALRPTWIIGVTGHRTIDPALVAPKLTEAFARVRAALPGNASLELLSSLAEGTDLLAHKLAAAEGLRTHTVLPMTWSEFEKDLGPEARVEALAASSKSSSSRVAVGDGERPDCYADANTELLLLSDVIVAVWDGEPARGVGGTAEVVTQARALGRPLLWLHSTSGALTVERLEALDKDTHEALLETAQRILRHPEADTALATNVRKNLWRSLLVGIAASIVGAAAAAVGSAQDLVPLVAWVSLLGIQALLAGWLLVEKRVMPRRAPVQTWLESRFAVEVLAGVEASAGLVDPLRPTLSSVEPSWHRFAVSAAASLHASLPAASWQERRDRYIELRLLGPRGQVAYFEAQGARATEQLTRQRRRAQLAAAASLAAAGASFLWKGSQLVLKAVHLAPAFLSHPVAVALIRFLPAAIPAVAAGVLSVEFLFDRKRRASQYPLIAQRLRTLAALLRTQPTEHGARRLVEACERILMTELHEWRASEERATGKNTATRRS